MVIKTSNSSSSTTAYISTSTSVNNKHVSSTGMADQMAMMTNYFATFDGSERAASAFQEAFRVAFHWT